jgi:hypothetical protein
VGKTTLARQIGELAQPGHLRSAVYPGLERPSDRQKLIDAEADLSLHSQQLVLWTGGGTCPRCSPCCAV